MKAQSASSNAVSQDLRRAVADLEGVNPWVGLWRFVSLGVLFLSAVGLAWSASTLGWFVGFTAIAGLLYAFWLICTHDTAHHTLTGWPWFDEWMPRLISYPMLWPYGTYAQLHRLHHAWNGIDLRDPERVQWTASEYQQAAPWQRWYVRHQWGIDIFGLGGIGLIAKTVCHGLRLGYHLPALHRLLLEDVLGMVVIQSGLAIAAILHGRFLHYLLFWLILERIIGIVQQTRDHLEHYGLWTTQKGHQLTQLYASRNLQTPAILHWLMGGLPDHAVHHAFPSIQFHRLPAAFHRIQAVLQHHHYPTMNRGAGYFRETQWLSSTLLTIDDGTAGQSEALVD